MRRLAFGRHHFRLVIARHPETAMSERPIRSRELELLGFSASRMSVSGNGEFEVRVPRAPPAFPAASEHLTVALIITAVRACLRGVSKGQVRQASERVLRAMPLV